MRQRAFIDKSYGKAAPFRQSAGTLTAAPRSVAGLSALEILMDKKIAGLLGAVATLGTLSTAQAAPAPAPVPTDALQANSFSDRLEPIPNAKALLQAIDEQAPTPSAQDNVQLAQFYHHHHHHHHHNHWRRPYVVVVPHRRWHHHHHHHHHHHGYYRRY
jgi:hypothetical protein